MDEKLELILAKGVKDWWGREAILRNHVRDTLRCIFERYGFSPLETPVIEREDVLGFKGGGEIQKEVFRLQDQGGRSLALRFDHTVPLARFFANHTEMRIPYRRYVIGDVFRDGPTQPEQGRYRIFGQCDVDIIGVGNMAAEAELLALASDAFCELGLGDVTIKVNNRKVLDGIMDVAKVPMEFKMQVILVIDKLEKIGVEGVKGELREIGESSLTLELVDALIDNVIIEGSNEEKIAGLKGMIVSENGVSGLEEIEELLDYCGELGLDLTFDPSLARGLDYYTGSTFEVFLKRRDIVGSAIVAGGRFDNLLGDFKGSDEPVPAVGISFGLERVCQTLNDTLEGLREGVVDFYIIPLGTLRRCLGVAHGLRNQGIRVEVDLINRGLRSAMRCVNSMGIPFVGILGEDEVSRDVITVKRLSDGQQNQIPISEIGGYLEEQFNTK